MKNTDLTIGEYIDSYLPAIDGVIITVQNYARWLNEDHCECYVATAEGPKGHVDQDPFRVIRYRSMPVPKRPPYRFGLPFLDFSFVVEQHSLFPDLVHMHSPFASGQEAIRIAKANRIPLVASFHSKYYDDVLQATNSKLLAEGATKLIVDIYNAADHVWTVNKTTADTLRSYGYEKSLEIMPNGIDFSMPKNPEESIREINRMYNLKADEKIVLYVGQHILQKNLMMLLEAVALCVNQGATFKLLMVGEGYAKKELIETAEALGIEDHVIFSDPIEDRTLLSSVYLRADLFAFPSLYDTFGLVVGEAAAAKCPSIVIRGSNAAEQCVENINAFFCENSKESLKDTILHALRDDALRVKIGENASKTIGRPWRDVVQDVYERYLQIIDDYKRKQ